MNKNDSNINNSFAIDPSLKIDHVHLRVSNLNESVNFYQSFLGFKVLKDKSTPNTAFLTAAVNNTKTNMISENKNKEKISPLLVLTQIDNQNAIFNHKTIRKESGLYHFAILLPDRKFLASFLRHIQKNLDPRFYEGMADHAVSESIYIHDLDYNGIEIYRDRLPSQWKWNGDKVYMVTDPLDVKDLFKQNPDEIWTELPSNTTIGHVHLHVSNLNRSKQFYQNILGLNHTASYPGTYFFAANHYHHHIATNTWIGTNILPANNSNSKPGLDHYAVRLPNFKGEEIRELKNRLENIGINIDETIHNESDMQQYASSFYVYDPDGIKIKFLFD
jgi:catechol 2,3-dioxygenase